MADPSVPEPIVEALDALNAVFRRLGAEVGEVLKSMEPAAMEKRARLRRMHSSYRAKWGKRR